LLLAGLAWSVTGAALLAAGIHWSLAASPGRAFLILGAAAVAGWTKGRYLLRSRAERNAARILASEDGRCLGGAFSWQAWLFVALMIGLGAALRRSPVSRLWLGFVYAAVGAALLIASAATWRHWLRARGAAAGAGSGRSAT
jgi:hypothetical protein